MLIFAITKIYNIVERVGLCRHLVFLLIAAGSE